MKKIRKKFSYSKYINLNPTTDDTINGSKKPLSVVENIKKRYQDDPSHREWGTDSLTDIYKNDTPGQKPKMKRFKHFFEMNEINIRTVDNKLQKLPDVPVRMISGDIKKMPPGKSGSSGGGEGS
jgi:hypothetical protein